MLCQALLHSQWVSKLVSHLRRAPFRATYPPLTLPNSCAHFHPNYTGSRSQKAISMRIRRIADGGWRGETAPAEKNAAA